MSEIKTKLHKMLRISEAIENLQYRIGKLSDPKFCNLSVHMDGLGLYDLPEEDIEELKLWVLKKQEDQLCKQYQLLEERLLELHAAPVAAPETFKPDVITVIQVGPAYLTPEQVEQARWK